MTEQDALAKIASAVKTFKNQQLAADAWDISLPYLGDILRGRRRPTNRILIQVNLERVTTIRAARKAVA